MACSNHLFIVVLLPAILFIGLFGPQSLGDPSVTSPDDLYSEPSSLQEDTPEGESVEVSALGSEQPFTDQVTTEQQTFTDEVTSEQVSTEQVSTEQVSTEQVLTEQLQTTKWNATDEQQEVIAPAKPLGPYQFQVVDDDTDQVCIKAYIEAELIVHYISSKKTSLQQATIPVDTKATVGGTCSKEQAMLTLDWTSKTNSKYCLQTTFNMINNSVKCTNSKNGVCWMLTSIQFTYESTDNTYFYHAKDARIKTVQSSVDKEFFKTPDTMSQTCDKDVLLKLPVSDDRNKDEVDIKFVKLQVQPFNLVNNTFGPRKECEEGNAGSQSAVSIAVGATLGVVILIVIIIYAVGRRIGAINDRTGYKSVD